MRIGTLQATLIVAKKPCLKSPNMMENLVPLLLGVCTAGLAILAGLGVRRLGAPGAGLLCAVLVGAFMGPTVAGRIAPDWFDATWIGDRDDVASLQALEAEHEAARLVETSRDGAASGFSSRILEERERVLRERRSEIIDANHVATRYLVIACCVLLIGGSCVRRPRVGHHQDALLCGAWLVVCCGGLVLLTTRLTGTPGTFIESIWVTCGGALVAVSGVGQQPGRRLLHRWSTCACLLTLLGLTGAVILTGNEIAPPLLLLLPAAIGSWFMIDTGLGGRIVETMMRRTLAPAVIAITMLDIDLTATLTFAWIPIVLWLVMGDLRWLVGTTCLRMSGVTWARAAVRGLPLMGAAWIAVPLAGVGYWTGQLGPEVVVWLLGAAAVVELEGDWRGSAARSIANARRIMGSVDAAGGG